MSNRDMKIQCLRKHLGEASKHLALAFGYLESLEAEEGGSTALLPAPKESKKERVDRYISIVTSGKSVNKPIQFRKHG